MLNIVYINIMQCLMYSNRILKVFYMITEWILKVIYFNTKEMLNRSITIILKIL